MAERSEVPDRPQLEGVFVKSIINQAQTMVLSGVSHNEIKEVLTHELTKQFAELKKDLVTTERLGQIVQVIVENTATLQPNEPLAQREIDSLAEAIVAKLGPHNVLALKALEPRQKALSGQYSLILAKGTQIRTVLLMSEALFQWNMEIEVECRQCIRDIRDIGTLGFRLERDAISMFFHRLARVHTLRFTFKLPDGSTLVSSKYSPSEQDHSTYRLKGSFQGVYTARHPGRYLLELTGFHPRAKKVSFHYEISSQEGIG